MYAGIDVQEPGGTVRNPKPITSRVTNMAYTVLSQPKAWNWASGDSANRTFDLDGRMSSNEFASYQYDVASTRYTYDANSNRLTAIDTVTSDTDLDGVFEATDFAKTTNQTLNVEGTSNRLLGLVQTVVTTNNNTTKSVVTTPVSYTMDANGAMTSDGLRTFRLRREQPHEQGQGLQGWRSSQHQLPAQRERPAGVQRRTDGRADAAQ